MAARLSAVPSVARLGHTDTNSTADKSKILVRQLNARSTDVVKKKVSQERGQIPRPKIPQS